jgi:hypothetical protein
MDRKRRGIPGKRPVLELQPRDYDILECLGRLGHLGADLLAAHFWGDKESDPARRRLRKLTDLRAISVTLVGARSANLYSLSRVGSEYLVGARGELDGVHLHDPVRAAAGVAHGQLVASFRLYLAAMAEAGHGQLEQWSGGRGAEADELGLRAAHIAPDGIARVTLYSGARRSSGFALVECDIGTEGTAMRSKLAAYMAYFGHGTAPNVQLWIACAGGPQRRATVLRWVWAAGLQARTRIYPAAVLLERPAVAPIPRLDRLGAGSGT